MRPRHKISSERWKSKKHSNRETVKKVDFGPVKDSVIASFVISLAVGVVFPFTASGWLLESSEHGDNNYLNELSEFFASEVFQDPSSYITACFGIVAVGATLYLSAVSQSRSERMRELRDSESLIQLSRVFNLAVSLLFAFSFFGSLLQLWFDTAYCKPSLLIVVVSCLCWSMSCVFFGLCSPGEIIVARNLERVNVRYREALDLDRELAALYGVSKKGVPENATFRLIGLSAAFHCALVLVVLSGAIYVFRDAKPFTEIMYLVIVAPMCYFLILYVESSVFVFIKNRLALIFFRAGCWVVLILLYALAQTGISASEFGEYYSDMSRFRLAWVYVLLFVSWVFVTIAPLLAIYTFRPLRKLIYSSRIFYSKANIDNVRRARSRLSSENKRIRRNSGLAAPKHYGY